ncbi:unnamed protein product [Prunus armeniaca]
MALKAELMENEKRSSSSKLNPYAKPYGDHYYHCGKLGHKFNNCPNRRQVNLAEANEDHGANEKYEGGDFVYKEGNKLINLVLQWLLLAPRQEEVQRHKIFQSFCTVNNKLPTEKHESPYSLRWVKRGPSIQVTEVCKIPLSIGSHKIVMAPLNDFGKPEKPAVNSSFLTIASNERDCLEVVKDPETIYHVVMKGLLAVVPEKAQLLKEELIANDLPNQLPPMRDIQDQIDLVSGASLPNLPHYRISPKENDIL